MKKFISGLIIGVLLMTLLMTGVSAFADSVSLVGQKVQGLFSIEKAGEKVADAVIINSTAYAPVRAVAEATGASLTVEGKTITMGDSAISEASVSDTSGVKTLLELQKEREKIAADISRYELGINDLEQNVIPGLEDQANILSTNGKIGEAAKETLEQYKEQVINDKAKLATLQQKLAEIDAQIVSLQE